MSNNLYSRIRYIYIFLTELVCDWTVNSQIKATLMSSTCSCWRLAGTAWLRGVWADPDLCAEKTKSNVLIGRKWKAAYHAVGLLGKDTAIRMGLLFLGFPWSVLSVIGLPGTAFPEKWLQRVFKEQYQPSNCFAGCCCDVLEIHQRCFRMEHHCWGFPLHQGTWMPRIGFPLECVCPASSSAGKKGFRANGLRNSRNGEEGTNGSEVKTKGAT